METITIPKKEYLALKKENKHLKNSKLYKKVLKAKKELEKKTYTREDLNI